MNQAKSSAPADKVRLQKVLAAAGLGSRRGCEEFILEGRVEVNGRTITELGTRVDPDQDTIRVDGEVVKTGQRRRYYAVNKPIGVVCTHHDPGGRKRVVDLVPAGEQVFPIGRLDRASSGLMILTDDGEFANLIAHPRFGVPKTYRVRVAGRPSPTQLEKLRKGVYLAEGKVKAESVRIRRRYAQSTELEIVLKEGRNREIRRMLATLGHKVQQLKRVAIGPLRLDKDLATGCFRPLRPEEVRQLRKAASSSQRPRQLRKASRTRQNASSDRGKKGRRAQPTAGRHAPRRSGPVLNLVGDEDDS